MGRNKQPVELLVAKGNKHLTKEEIKQRQLEEIKAPDDNIVAPSYLTKKQTEIFYDYSKQLQDLQIISNLDVELLARYVSMNDMYEKITKKLRNKDVMSDIVKLDYYTRMQERYVKLCRSLANDIGLSVTSRMKLVVPPKKNSKEKVSKFEQFRK